MSRLPQCSCQSASPGSPSSRCRRSLGFRYHHQSTALSLTLMAASGSLSASLTLRPPSHSLRGSKLQCQSGEKKRGVVFFCATKPTHPFTCRSLFFCYSSSRGSLSPVLCSLFCSVSCDSPTLAHCLETKWVFQMRGGVLLLLLLLLLHDVKQYFSRKGKLQLTATYVAS